MADVMISIGKPNMLNPNPIVFQKYKNAMRCLKEVFLFIAKNAEKHYTT